MKIEGPGSSQGAAGAKKSGKAGTKGNIFAGLIAGETSAPASSGPASSIAMADMLLAVQGAEDPTARAARRRMRERADTILNSLDKIRVAMLAGNLTVGDMIDVADVVASHREKITDPALTAIMDEIDLRAQVEIAKMRVALEKPGV